MNLIQGVFVKLGRLFKTAKNSVLETNVNLNWIDLKRRPKVILLNSRPPSNMGALITYLGNHRVFRHPVRFLNTLLWIHLFVPKHLKSVPFAIETLLYQHHLYIKSGSFRHQIVRILPFCVWGEVFKNPILAFIDFWNNKLYHIDMRMLRIVLVEMVVKTDRPIYRSALATMCVGFFGLGTAIHRFHFKQHQWQNARFYKIYMVPSLYHLHKLYHIPYPPLRRMFGKVSETTARTPASHLVCRTFGLIVFDFRCCSQQLDWLQTLNGFGKWCVLHWTYVNSFPGMKRAYLSLSAVRFAFVCVPVFINFLILNIGGFNAFYSDNLIYNLTTRLCSLRLKSVSDQIEALIHLPPTTDSKSDKPHHSISHQTRLISSPRLRSALNFRLRLFNMVVVDIDQSEKYLFQVAIGVMFLLFNAMTVMHVSECATRPFDPYARLLTFHFIAGVSRLFCKIRRKHFVGQFAERDSRFTNAHHFQQRSNLPARLVRDRFGAYPKLFFQFNHDETRLTLKSIETLLWPQLSRLK